MSITGLRKRQKPKSGFSGDKFLFYSNSEYVYAIPLVAIALFWGNGARRIAASKPMSMIFTILTHRLNATARTNYSVWAKGQWLREDIILIESPH